MKCMRVIDVLVIFQLYRGELTLTIFKALTVGKKTRDKDIVFNLSDSTIEYDEAFVCKV